MNYIEKVIPYVIVVGILLAAYYSRACYETSVPGAKKFLTQDKSAA
jgi:hypothetical protein